MITGSSKGAFIPIGDSPTHPSIQKKLLLDILLLNESPLHHFLILHLMKDFSSGNELPVLCQSQPLP